MQRQYNIELRCEFLDMDEAEEQKADEAMQMAVAQQARMLESTANMIAPNRKHDVFIFCDDMFMGRKDISKVVDLRPMIEKAMSEAPPVSNELLEAIAQSEKDHKS